MRLVCWVCGWQRTALLICHFNNFAPKGRAGLFFQPLCFDSALWLLPGKPVNLCSVSLHLSLSYALTTAHTNHSATSSGKAGFPMWHQIYLINPAQPQLSNMKCFPIILMWFAPCCRLRHYWLRCNKMLSAHTHTHTHTHTTFLCLLYPLVIGNQCE